MRVTALFLVLLGLLFVASVHAEEEEEEDVSEAFLTWLKMNGMSKTKLAQKEDGSPGLVVTQDVKAGERLGSIPKKIKMSIDTISPISNVISGLQSQGLEKKEALALYLLFEKHREDEESYWAPYIDTLPAFADYKSVPMFWPKEEQEMLAGSAALLLEEQLQYLDMMDNAVEQLCEMHPQYFQRNIHTRAEVMWAMQTVYQRMWVRDKNGEESTYAEPVMLPFGDLLRSSTEGGAEISISKAGRVVITADRAYKEGEEVFIHAQPRGAASQLLNSGSVSTADLESNFAKLNYQPQLETDDLFSPTIVHLLKNAECLEGLTLGKLVQGAPLSASFIRCLRIVFLTPQEYARVAQYEADSEKAWDTDTIFSLENERTVIATLLNSIEGLLDTFNTTEAEDKKLLDESSLTDNARKAILLRVSERRLLQHGVEELERMWMQQLRDSHVFDEVDEEEAAEGSETQ